MKRHRIFSAVFSVSGVILLTKLLGFIKQAVTASAFGATIETDLISLSEGFIGNVHYVLVQVLLTSFTTVYIHSRERDEQDAGHFAMDVIRAFSLIALALSAAVLLAAPLVARIIAPSYSPELSARLAGYLRLFAPLLTLFIWTAVFHALLSANRRFIPGELSGLFQSVIVLVLVTLWGKAAGPRVLVLAFFIYNLWNVLYLGFFSRKYWRWSRGNPFRNEQVRLLLQMAGPLLLGYSMIYINQQVDKILSSGLGDGTVTSMGYAAVLSNLVGTFIASFCSILFTYITTQIAKGNHSQAAFLTMRAASIMVIVFFPVSLLTILCSEDIISIVYARGSFHANAVRTAAQALRGYGFLFVPSVLREVFNRFHYGYRETRRPMLNSTLSVLLNIVLSISLCPRLGVFGITLASSAAELFCGVLNMWSARRHNRALSFRPLLRLLPWMGVGGALCVLAARWAMAGPLAGSAPILRFTLVVVVGFGAYLPAIALPLWRLLRKGRA